MFVKIFILSNVCWLEFCNFTENEVSPTLDVFKFNNFSKIFSPTLANGHISKLKEHVILGASVYINFVCLN